MSLSGLHGYLIGFVLIGAWGTICGWALALRFTKYEETPTFWRAVSVAQILLVVQVLVGVVLFVMGRTPGPSGGTETVLFHLAYGFLFPVIVLVVGHRVARDGKYDAHSVFAVVGLVIFGLMARAWMVGSAGA